MSEVETEKFLRKTLEGVINEEERELLSKRDPNNVVKLILSRDDPESGEDKYQVAARTLTKLLGYWLIIKLNVFSQRWEFIR